MRIRRRRPLIFWAVLLWALGGLHNALAADGAVTVFVAGDVLLGRGAASALRHAQTPLQRLGAESRAADIAFCNLECSLSAAKREPSVPPRLIAPPSAVRDLRGAGMDVVSLANNHALDGGQEGVQTTLAALHGAGMAGVGARLGQGEWREWARTIRKRRAVWLAASAFGPWQRGSARIRPLAGSGLLEQIRALARSGAIVFVSLHWGREYSRTPTDGQRQTARALIDAGAAAVVGHHPHVSQPCETYHGRPIFYSLGNYVFDSLPGRVQDGFAALISVSGAGAVSYRVLPLNAPPIPAGETVVRQVPGRFVRPFTSPQMVVWSRRRDGTHVLRAFVQREGRWRCVAEGRHPALFDVQVGDIDHDGRDELILGLFQRSKLDIRVGRRLYVYAVDPKGGFRPRWRGSGLSLPFRRFWLLPAQNGCDLVALEKNTLPEYRQFDWLGVYRWSGFGLRLVWETPVRGRVQDLRAGRDNRGSYVAFTQSEAGLRRRLTLRPRTGPDGMADFKATEDGKVGDLP